MRKKLNTAALNHFLQISATRRIYNSGGYVLTVARKMLGQKKTPRVSISSKNFFKTVICSQCASAAPPLGPLLGNFGLNIANFCKEFNEKTRNYKKGIPLPVTVRIKADRSYVIEMGTPRLSYYLKQAAGIERGKLPDETKSGEITLKHLYEIANIKHKDPFLKYQIYELEEVVRHVANTAKVLGLEFVKEINPDAYKEFLIERKKYLEEVAKTEEEKKKLKFQRV